MKKKASGTAKKKLETLDTKVYKFLKNAKPISKAMKMMDVDKLKEFQLYIHGGRGYGWNDISTTVTPMTFPWKNFETHPEWQLIPLPDSKTFEYYIMGSYAYGGVTYNVRIGKESLPLLGRFLRKYKFVQAERMLKSRIQQQADSDARFIETLEKNVKNSHLKVKNIKLMYKLISKKE